MFCLFCLFRLFACLPVLDYQFVYSVLCNTYRSDPGSMTGSHHFRPTASGRLAEFPPSPSPVLLVCPLLFAARPLPCPGYLLLFHWASCLSFFLSFYSNSPVLSLSHSLFLLPFYTLPRSLSLTTTSIIYSPPPYSPFTSYPRSISYPFLHDLIPPPQCHLNPPIGTIPF